MWHEGASLDIYVHVKSLLAIILGLGIGHLLRGVALVVQKPKTAKPYWVHLTWALFLFFYLVHFWWWEFNLQRVVTWTFPIYFFIAIYATIAYLLCTVLMPEDLQDYDGFRDYFYSRKNWFFGLLVILFIADIVDTLIKGTAYRQSLGLAYEVRVGIYIVLSLTAMKIKSPKFHAAFAIVAVLYEAWYIMRYYSMVG